MFYGRVLSEVLSSGVSRNKVRLVFGARQTGKTELLRRVVPAENCRFYDLAVSAERRRFESDPSRFGREARALPSDVANIVIDEIQKVPALLDEIQNLFDEQKTRFQIYLTGSSARSLRRRSANLLPGRSHVYRLLPVCQWESEVPERHAWPGNPKGKPDLNAGLPLFPAQSLQRTLLFGNLPGIRQEETDTAAATLAAYVENYLEEEIRREAAVRDLGSFAVFLKLAAAESGSQVNLAALSQESGVPASSLKNYYQVLEETFTGFWMRAYGRPGRKRLLTTPRFYFFDTGVRNAAADLPPTDALFETEGSRLLEHWVGLELTYRAAYQGLGYSVTFWRTTSGAEVDFVWESPSEDVPIEVKWTTRPRAEDARHLERFLSAYPRRAHCGLVVCRCERPEQLTDRVTAIPWNTM
jgi:predicted AAA+ superfamily ATPase